LPSTHLSTFQYQTAYLQANKKAQHFIVLFLDEPTIGLDVITQYNIRDFLKHYCSTYHATLILTSHNFNDIVSLCSELILINNGEKERKFNEFSSV